MVVGFLWELKFGAVQFALIAPVVKRQTIPCLPGFVVLALA
jgi:hypothetical protein